MLIKDEKFIKGIIKEILILQNKVLLTGGYHLYADEYRMYLFHIEHLLKKFDVPFTPENVRYLFDFPLSPVSDLTDRCNVCSCPVMEEKMTKAFKVAVESRCFHSYKRYPFFWSMNERVEYVYGNLVMMTDVDPPIIT